MHQDITNRDSSMEIEMTLILEDRETRLFLRKASIGKYEIIIENVDNYTDILLNKEELGALKYAIDRMLGEAS
jgi:hypothetical protein